MFYCFSKNQSSAVTLILIRNGYTFVFWSYRVHSSCTHTHTQTSRQTDTNTLQLRPMNCNYYYFRFPYTSYTESDIKSDTIHK